MFREELERVSTYPGKGPLVGHVTQSEELCDSWNVELIQDFQYVASSAFEKAEIGRGGENDGMWTKEGQ
jgi:hypothetical protein